MNAVLVNTQQTHLQPVAVAPGQRLPLIFYWLFKLLKPVEWREMNQWKHQALHSVSVPGPTHVFILEWRLSIAQSIAKLIT